MKKFALLLCALMVFAASGAARAAMSDGDFLHLCQTGPAEQVRGAIQAGANVGARGEENGFTPLIVAAGFNADPEVIPALIEAGAAVNAQDAYGMTPLMWAAWKNHNPEVIAALLHAGADAGARNKSGLSALDLALKNDSLKNTDVLKLLERSSTRAAMNYRDFIWLCASGSAEEVQDAIRSGVNVNAKTEDDPTLEQGRTVLMWAAQYNKDPAVIKVLVNAGADVNAKDRAGRTALMWAEQFNRKPEVIAALVEAGATPDIARDKNGSEGMGSLTPPEEKINETVEQLVRDFLDNPFRAEKERAGMSVTIEGKIASLGTDRDTGSPAIIFEHQDGAQAIAIKCLVSKDDPLLMKVSRGETITVQGIVSLFDSDGVIVMRECRILK